jgi:hypothetical protein
MAGFFTSVKGVAAKLSIGTVKAANTGGAFVNMQPTDVFAGPAAASVSAATSLLITPVAVSDSAGATGVIIAQPDFPRNLTVWCTVANTGAVTIVGTDQFDNVQTEIISANGAAIVAGLKVFKKITSVTSANRSGSATTLSIGQGSILGTSRKMNSLQIDGAVYTTASLATTAVQETTRPVKAPTVDVHGVTFSTALDPAKTYLLTYGSSEVR